MAATPAALADRPTTRAQVRYVRMSASKARQVLDLIRGKSVGQADEILALSERDAAHVIQKCLRSAVANAEHNDGLDPEELFVATCFADEGPTLRRFRPRARGRATRIRKRTCHITVIVGRYSADELAAIASRERAKGTSAGRSGGSSDRRRRVAKSRGEEVTEETTDEVTEEPTEVTEDVTEDGQESSEVTEDEQPTAEVADDDSEASEVSEDEQPQATESAAETDEATDESTASTALAEANSKDELLAIAEAEGVEVAKSWNKAQIAEAIVNGREDD